MKKLMNKKGFTIVELVIVIAVIAILAAVLIPTFSNVIEKANESKALQNVRNNYTQISVLSATNGDTLADGTVFESDGFYFKLDKGQLVKVEESVVTDKSKFSPLENGAKMFIDTYIKVASKEEADWLNESSRGEAKTDFYVSEDTHIEQLTGKKAPYDNLDKLITVRGIALKSGCIKDSSGNIVIEYTIPDSTSLDRISFSMFYESGRGNRLDAISKKQCTEYTTKEQATGWYSYEIVDGTKTVKGYFYYE